MSDARLPRGELPRVRLPGGEEVAALGQGTWHMGEDRRRAADEAAALALGIELGMTLIDTAEMYGSGGAETVVREAAQGRREKLFVVSKVLPYNASRAGTIAACERSLRRLGTDRIDLYLLHWRGSVPLAETLEAFLRLARDGKIRYHGVSNFDRRDLEEWAALAGGASLVADQVLYNLATRGIEWNLRPWCRERGIAIMAYTPLGHGRMLVEPSLAEVARRHAASPAQVALAWLLHQGDTVVIPKAARAEHVRENRGAADLRLSAEDLALIDRTFPPPRRESPLGIG
jgi:diketogulonate reductase-like aldo/keto reductase